MSKQSYLEKLLDGEEVEWLQLKNLTDDRFWIMPATPNFNEQEDVPYITSKNIHGWHIHFNRVKFISQSDYLDLSRNRPILEGDILISMIGTIGEVAKVKDKDLPFYGQNMYLLRLNSNIIKSDYFLHFFDSPTIKHYFRSTKNNSGQGYLKANNIEELQIPIPCPSNPKKSLAIQGKIVRILDAFTELTTELTTELNMRKKQYNYYRDRLFDFDDGEVEWKTLGDKRFFKIANSARKPVKANLRVSGKTPYYGANNIQDYVNDFTHNGEYVLIAEDGSKSLESYSIQYAMGQFWANNHVHVVAGSNIVNTRYLYHYLCIVNFMPFLTGGGRAKLTKGEMIKIPVPIPCPDNPTKSLAEQTRIVSILDKFDALTNSISEGLPREINLRQKQYEYYRDLLLSFRRLAEVDS